jgi:hypothetical protein
MNYKRISLLSVLAIAITTTTLTADVWEGSTGTFSGVITAVESDRDSFTVENSDGVVKMFKVSPSRKSTLTSGSKVTVSYQDDYQWPLKTTSISGGGYMK